MSTTCAPVGSLSPTIFSNVCILSNHGLNLDAVHTTFQTCCNSTAHPELTGPFYTADGCYSYCNVTSSDDVLAVSFCVSIYGGTKIGEQVELDYNCTGFLPPSSTTTTTGPVALIGTTTATANTASSTSTTPSPSPSKAGATALRRISVTKLSGIVVGLLVLCQL